MSACCIAGYARVYSMHSNLQGFNAAPDEGTNLKSWPHPPDGPAVSDIPETQVHKTSNRP